MSRQKVVSKIEFVFDVDQINQDRTDNDMEPMSEQELLDYATECFVDDIYSMVKYGELHGAVRSTIERG